VKVRFLDGHAPPTGEEYEHVNFEVDEVFTVFDDQVRYECSNLVYTITMKYQLYLQQYFLTCLGICICYVLRRSHFEEMINT